jgi:hypothetical protein
MYGWNSPRVEVQAITSSSLSSADSYTVWCEHFPVEHSVLIFRPFCSPSVQHSTRYNCHGSRFTQSLPMMEMSSDDGRNCSGTLKHRLFITVVHCPSRHTCTIKKTRSSRGKIIITLTHTALYMQLITAAYNVQEAFASRSACCQYCHAWRCVTLLRFPDIKHHITTASPAITHKLNVLYITWI